MLSSLLITLREGLEAALIIGIIPPLVEHVWDNNHILPEKSAFGRFLTAIVGYNGNPSLVEVVAYFVYLASALGGYFRPLTVAERKVEAMVATRQSLTKGS